MNIMNKVTLQAMKKNRVRTIVTIIGIILSAAMFTAVTTFCSSMYGYMREYFAYDKGDYHVSFSGCSSETIDKIKADERVSKAAVAKPIGYAEAGSSNADKPYLYVLEADESFMKNMPVHLTGGRLPENENEIILPAHLQPNGGVSHKIGDRLKLTLGRRVAEDGSELGQNNPYSYDEEKLTADRIWEYVVVGFYERPGFEEMIAPGYTALSLLSEPLREGETYDAYILMKNPRKNLDAFAEKLSGAFTEASYQTSLLTIDGYSVFNNYSNMLVSLAAVFCVLIFIGSVSLIYSAFSISVSERTKQFGLLASIGATRSQIRRSVLFEAFALCVCGIPIGLLVGIGGMGITLWLCGDLFKSVLDAPFGMSFSVSWQAVAVAVTVAVLTVFVSAWIPSRRAMKISPIEAIGQARDVNAGKKNVRCSKLFIRLFGAEGMLAKKYYARSRKKYRATIASLAMSLVLFISASGFCMYLTKSAEDVFTEKSYDICYRDLSAQNYTEFAAGAREYFDEITFCLNTLDNSFVYLSEGDTTAEYKAYTEAQRSAHEGLLKVEQNCFAYYIDDAAFGRMLTENGIDADAYFAAEEKLPVMLNSGYDVVYSQDNGENNRRTYNYSFVSDGVTTLMRAKPAPQLDGYILDGMFWSGNETGEGVLQYYYWPAQEEDADGGSSSDGENSSDGEDFESSGIDFFGRPIDQPVRPVEYEEIHIAATVKTAPAGIDSGRAMKLILPFSAFKDQKAFNEGFMNVYICADDPDKAENDVKSVFETRGIEFAPQRLYNRAEEERTVSNMIILVKVFSYGFIALISLISVANVFNTVSTNVALRRRDYAMLRSLGMTNRGINRMMNYECLLYGTRSLLFGFPLSVGMTYLCYLSAAEAAQMSFTMPWTAVAIAVVSVFMVVFVSMLYSTSRLKRENPVDALKDENI